MAERRRFRRAAIAALGDEQAGEAMRVSDFRAWMDAYGLTQEAAAEALGLSRRMIAYYLSGVIPKTVMLANEGWAAREEA